jgi:hypothetical protein
MAYGKRKKGGQRLMEIARAGAKRRADRKKKTLAQARANIKKGPVTRGSTPSRDRTKVQITMNKPVRKTVAKAPVTKAPAAKKSDTKKPAAKKPAKTDAQKLADYRKNPTKGMAPRNLRTEAQRAALRKRLMNQKSEAKGMSDLGAGLTKDLADAEFATKLAIEVGAAPIGGGLASGAARKVAKTALGKKVKEQIAKRGLTKEGRKLRKAGNYRDTKGQIQKIDKNPFKKGGAKKKSKSDAIEVDVYGPRTRSTFNPKGEPATKGASKPKPTPKAEPKSETKPKVKAKSKTKTPGKKKVAKKAPAKKKAVKKTKKPSVLKKGVNKAKNPQTKFKQDQLKRNMKKRGKR